MPVLKKTTEDKRKEVILGRRQPWEEVHKYKDSCLVFCFTKTLEQRLVHNNHLTDIYKWMNEKYRHIHTVNKYETRIYVQDHTERKAEV